MNRVTHELEYLRLSDLNDEWVEAVYFAEFLEFGEFPAEYAQIVENVEIRSVFRKIMGAVDSWLRGSRASADEDTSWAVLSHQVNHRKLLTLLAYYIDYGSKNIMSHEHRNTSLLAARVYFKMLSIPGYKAYHIYHSQLFAQSLGCLSYPKILCENEDNYFNLKQLTREVNSVIKEVGLFVADLRAVIEALQLNPADMNFEDILSNLVEFTGGAIVNKLDIDKIELVNISTVIYEMIDILLCDLNGEPNADAIQLLFKCLLPKLVAASVDNKSANNLVRASYVTYSGLVLTRYGNSALSGFITLLQHLCYTCDGLERAEVRSARVSLVIGLMSILPQKSYRYIVRWILKLSNTAKVAHRHIALELIAQLLNNEPEEQPPAPPPPEQPDASSQNQEPISSQPENPDLVTGDAPAISAPGSQEVTSSESQNISVAVPDPANDVAMAGPLNDETVCPSGVQSTLMDSDIPPLNYDDPTPGPSGIQKNITGTPGITNESSQDTDSVTGAENPENITDSGIQDPTIGFDSECEDYIMSILNNGQDLPEPIPELEDIDLQLAMFNDINGQQDITVEGETNSTVEATNSAATANPEATANPAVTANAAETVAAEVKQEVPPTTPLTSKKTKKGRRKASTEARDQEGTRPMLDDEQSQEPNPDQVSDDDIAGLLRQRAHTVPHAELLRAVYERVGDASSTLRARALALLSDCLASARAPMRDAVSELNGSGAVSRLMLVAARCVSDERAAVRKAAVALVQRELSAGPPPQPNDLGILVSLCRDASIIVRSAAIAALGELVTRRPSEAVFDAFLSGPMHQMSDPETKVQEQVVNLIEQVSIDRLQKYSPVGEDPLPWQFLAAITRHNMRRHLQKACMLLLKMSKCINHRVVDVVSTHLNVTGDARDLQCLVLLTSVARLVDYSDVNFILDYYYSLADSTQTRDQRLMPLTLELLTLWSRYLPPAQRTRLREHLAARLATASGDDGCRIPCATLAAHLDPTNLQWANELLQLSEKRALEGGGVQEWVRAADLSLVAPSPPSPALLTLFLCTIVTVYCSESLSVAEKRALEGGGVQEWVRAADLSLVAPEPPSPALLTLFLCTIVTVYSSESLSVAEKRALEGGGVQEWVRAADLSLVAPEPPSPALLTLFLCTIVTVYCSESLSVAEKRALEGGGVQEWVRAADLSLVAPSPPSPALLTLFLCTIVTVYSSESLSVAEKRALEGGGVQEWVRAADLSLVAPEPPSPALLTLFLSALQEPPPEWTAACHGAAVAGAGRLCVRSRGAAAAAAPALAHILHAPHHALQARVNALLALADICVRYTCIVEPLLGSVSACLGTAAPAPLRRCAARSLTRLLLAGYLRLRPPLYYKYCALLADSDADVREPAEYYLTSCLTPDAIYHHFVDCVVHYNSSKSESISFDARQLIYDVMLQRLSLVQKLNVQCRLAREVLEHAADMIEEKEQLEPAMSAALLDSITLLCGPRMKLPKKPEKQGDMADIDDLQERVTTNIVSHKMKRTVAEVLVPAVLRLYARVQVGQVATYLVRIANDLLVDYRQEIEELLDNDEELMKRISDFQQTIGLEPSFGNSRNLVTTSAPPEPDTPRAPRRRAAPRSAGPPPRKRALRI